MSADEDVQPLVHAYRSLDAHGLGECHQEAGMLPTCDILAGDLRKLVLVLADANE